MSDLVIKCEDISKQYRLGVLGSSTIGQDLNRWWAKIKGDEDPFLKVGDENKLDTIDGDFVWALKNINFEVRRGEVLGIIGKNGAGKSTLLKLLSRVTTPTSGIIKIKGKIASLLEVGTGFHPELTGKENIFLNGAILGMSKTEIRTRLDEIISFSGIGKYLNTPVKRYSSGMYVRLAFAVAAHLEPDILILDEVLAVGDAEFQKKCLGKMKDVSGQGRTVLFVSHNMAAINDLCTRCLLFEKGRISDEGETKRIVAKYLSSTFSTNKTNTEAENYPRTIAKYGIRAKIILIQMIKETIYWKEKPEFNFTVKVYDEIISELEFGFGINGENGVRIFTYESEKVYSLGESRTLSFNIRIDEPGLVPARYYIIVGVRSNVETLDAVENYLSFEILDIDKENNHFGHTQGPEISGYIDTSVSVKEIFN